MRLELGCGAVTGPTSKPARKAQNQTAEASWLVALDNSRGALADVVVRTADATIESQSLESRHGDVEESEEGSTVAQGMVEDGDITVLPPAIDRLDAPLLPPNTQDRSRWPFTPGLRAVAVICSAAVAFTWLGSGALAFGALLLGIASLMSTRRSALANAPAAFIVMLGSHVTFALALTWLGGSLSTPWAARIELTAAAVATLLVAWLRRKAPTKGWANRTEAFACIPAAVMAVLGVVLATRPLPIATSWFFRGFDNFSHLIIAADIQRTGQLSYAHNAYPRGWHSLVATITTATSGHQALNPAGFESLLSIIASSTWMLYALLCCTTALLTIRLGESLGAEGWPLTLSSMTSGATMLLGGFLAYSAGRGFQTTILLAVLAAAAATEVASRTGRRSPFVLGLSVMLACHTWQLVVPVVFLPLAFDLVRLYRSRGLTRSVKSWALALAYGCMLCVASTPPILSVARQVGLGHAGAPGAVEAVPILWLIPGILVSLLLLCARQYPPACKLVASMSLTAGALAVAVSRLVGVPLTSYYPNKILWHAAALSVPLIWAMLAIAVGAVRQRETRQSGHLPFLSALLVVPQSTLILCGFAILGHAAVGWSSLSPGGTITAITAPRAANAQVAWNAGASRLDDAEIRIFLDFYRADSPVGSPRRVLSHAEECALLLHARVPAVLSRMPVHEVRSAFRCVPNLQVVGIPDD